MPSVLSVLAHQVKTAAIHSASLVQRVAAGPDGICWLMPNHRQSLTECSESGPQKMHTRTETQGIRTLAASPRTRLEQTGKMQGMCVLTHRRFRLFSAGERNVVVRPPQLSCPGHHGTRRQRGYRRSTRLPLACPSELQRGHRRGLENSFHANSRRPKTPL